MKKQNYIVAIVATVFVGGVYASQEGKLLGDQARNHYIAQYDDLVERFDNECYLTPFSGLASKSTVSGCQELIWAIKNTNGVLFDRYGADQSKHLGGKRGQAIDYWNSWNRRQ